MPWFRIVPFLQLSLPLLTFVDPKKKRKKIREEKCQRICVAFGPGTEKKQKRTPNSISSGSRIAGAGPKRPKLHHNPTHLPPTATLCASTLSSKTQRQTWIIINTSFVAIRFRCIELNQQQRISLEIPTTESSPCSDDSTSGKRRISAVSSCVLRPADRLFCLAVTALASSCNPPSPKPHKAERKNRQLSS